MHWNYFFVKTWHDIQFDNLLVSHSYSACPSVDLLYYLQKIFNVLLRSQKVTYFFHSWCWSWIIKMPPYDYELKILTKRLLRWTYAK
jgi:hypothetical protein